MYNRIDIMTTEQTNIMTEGKPVKDPNALKIASFRTKEGVWAEFSRKAESLGLTATDVLKTAMEQFINGTYSPYDIHTAVSTNTAHHDNVLTRDDVMTIVNTAVSTLSLSNHDDDKALEELVKINIKPLTDRLEELETNTQSQFAAMRDEIKKPLAIVR